MKSVNVDNRIILFRILNFGASCFGYVVSWSSSAADYNTYLPQNTSQLKIFLLTYIGNLLSLIPLEILGASAYIITYTNPNWSYAYQINNIGGLLGGILSYFGSLNKFLLIILFLSNIAGNIPAIYSLSLSAQVIAPIFERIPRVFYTILGTLICILLGIISATKFTENLISCIDIISYIFSIFIVIIFQEHLFFRKCSCQNYDFHLWNKRKFLPISIAALFSSLIGIFGTILGMSQTWFTGPIAKAISVNNNQYYANVGFQMGFIFTAVTFPSFRFIELCLIKR